MDNVSTFATGNYYCKRLMTHVIVIHMTDVIVIHQVNMLVSLLHFQRTHL